MTSPVLGCSAQPFVVEVVKVWPWAAAIVKLPLIVKPFWIVSVKPASSAPPPIVNAPEPSAVGSVDDQRAPGDHGAAGVAQTAAEPGGARADLLQLAGAGDVVQDEIVGAVD